MAGTAAADTATPVAADVRVDIPGWVIPVVDGRAAVAQAVVIPAAAIPVEVIQGEVVTRVAVTAEDTTANSTCCRPQRFLR